MEVYLWLSAAGPDSEWCGPQFWCPGPMLVLYISGSELMHGRFTTYVASKKNTITSWSSLSHVLFVCLLLFFYISCMQVNKQKKFSRVIFIFYFFTLCSTLSLPKLISFSIKKSYILHFHLHRPWWVWHVLNSTRGVFVDLCGFMGFHYVSVMKALFFCFFFLLKKKKKVWFDHFPPPLHNVEFMCCIKRLKHTFSFVAVASQNVEKLKYKWNPTQVQISI